MPQAEFDSFTDNYDEHLNKSLAITGEEREFYARARIEWTAENVRRFGFGVKRILDYGCGDGANVPMLAARFSAETVHGVDLSSASISSARQAYSAPGLGFFCTSEWRPDGTIDLVFTNGVFHHIPPPERPGCFLAIHRALRPEGLFAFWENNPWNPGTKYVMSQCVFDEHAVTMSVPEAKRMIKAAGFRILQASSLFYFPRQLRFLRGAEKLLRWLPFGGQYLILCQKI